MLTIRSTERESNKVDWVQLGLERPSRNLSPERLWHTPKDYGSECVCRLFNSLGLSLLLQIAKIITWNKGWLFLFKRHWKASINIIQDRTNEGLFPREEEGKGAPTASEDALNAHHTPSWPTSESSPHSEFMISVPLQVCVRAALCLETFCWQGDWKRCINASASVLTLESLGGTLYFSKKFQQNKLPTNV